MLSIVLNTLRVLVEGPSDEVEDPQLIPTNVFATREDFNEAVVVLLEKANIENVYDFIKYCICIDTSIRHRIDENSAGDLIDGALIQPNDYVDLLNEIDRVFGVNDDTAGINIISGTQNRNPNFSGLCGAFIEIALEVLGEDEYDILKAMIATNLASCVKNPSTTNIWWLDTLTEIYSYESTVDGDDDLWYGVEETSDNKEIIQQWYLDLQTHQSAYWDAWVNANQTVSENSLAFRLLVRHNDAKQSLVNQYRDRFEGRVGLICEHVPFFEEMDEEMPYSVEQTLMLVISGFM